MLKLKQLKKEISFGTEFIKYDKYIKAFKKDIKILKEKIKNHDYSFDGLSDLNPNIYIIFIDNNLELALSNTKESLRYYLLLRFSVQRAKKYINLTGNIELDFYYISLLNSCRKLLIENKTTEEEILKIKELEGDLNND
jgi:hypothetical protein